MKIVCILVLSIVGLVFEGHAQCNILSFTGAAGSTSYNVGYSIAFGTDYSAGESFMAPANCLINSISYNVSGYQGTPDITSMTIYVGNLSSSLDGVTSVGSATQNITGDGMWSFNFAPPVAVSAGASYTWITGTPGPYFYMPCSPYKVYPYGTVKDIDGTITNLDIWFYISATVNTQPTTTGSATGSATGSSTRSVTGSSTGSATGSATGSPTGSPTSGAPGTGDSSGGHYSNASKTVCRDLVLLLSLSVLLLAVV